MKFRPEMIFYYRKTKLGISRLELSRRVYKISKSKVGLSEDRIMRLEDPVEYEKLNAKLDELGYIFKALDAKPGHFWK